MYDSYNNFICQKCGAVMYMKCGYGYFFYWQCPNGCNNHTVLQYTTSASTNEEDKLNN